MTVRRSLVGVLACIASFALPCAGRAAVPGWTTYHHDAARSGIDPDSTSPVAPAQAWQTSPALDGAIYGEPLVFGSRVYVATENDTVYALDAATGAIVWKNHVAPPVPSSALSCGDISPVVGITSTPVIDPSTGRIYVVGDTWNGSNAQHELFGLNLTDGSIAPGLPVAVDPSGSTPLDQLQRAGLALDAGKILIGEGGNAGDCGSYHGWLIAAPESGGATQTFEVDPTTSRGAIWGSGNAPAVDSSGGIWLSTGNGSSGTFGYQESVIDLDPANLNVLGFWAPANWSTLDSTDADLGSTMPLLLPGGLVFQIGKAGVGYLLSASSPGGEGGTPLYSASVCSGSWGGGIYYNGAIYVACSDGMHALALNPAGPSLSALSGWTVNSSAVGPPIAAGGLIWSAGWNNGVLYGLNPTSGATSYSQSLGSFQHFSTPSAGGGLLFVANASKVTAFQIASPPPPNSTSEALSSSANPAMSQGVTSSPSGAAGSVIPVISRLRARSVKRKLRLTFVLSESAKLTIILSRNAAGRIVNHHCRAGTQRGRRCTALLRKATFRVRGKHGRNTLQPRMRTLAPGRYTVAVTAVDASGARSKRYTVTFVVLGR